MIQQEVLIIKENLFERLAREGSADGKNHFFSFFK